MTDRTVRALALFATLQATFSDVHPYCDQILQRERDACGKGEQGPNGARCCARHVASYTAVQILGAVAVTRALGYRVPLPALLAGMAVNAGTHYVIDRREPFEEFLRHRWIKRGGYLDHATVQRRPGVIDVAGPGTALMEMDQAAHRLISVLASLIITWLAVRWGRRR